MELVCIRARADCAPGERVEVPDGAAYSETYFAGPGSPAAERAIADAEEARNAQAAADAERERLEAEAAQAAAESPATPPPAPAAVVPPAASVTPAAPAPGQEG